MTKLYIREFDALGSTENSDSLYLVPADQVADQVVDFTAGVTPSAAFNDKTQFVELCSDSGCSILFGTVPVAAATNWRLPGNVPKLVRIQQGLKYKVSAITNP